MMGTDYSFHPGAAEKAEVDTDHLKNVVPILEDLKKYVQDRLTQEVLDIKGKDCLGADHTVPFGKFQNAVKSAQTHKQYLQSIYNDYTNVAKNLDVAIRATKEIIKNYDDAEELNDANSKNIMKAFTDAGGSNGSPSTTSTATGSGY
jgi:hypothetical protein